MTRTTRRLIFYILLLVFLMAAPAVALYGLGWTFDFSKKVFVKTGTLNLKSYPKSANIFINGKTKKRTPRLVKHLPPRLYDLRIEKEGYQSWQKKLEVNSSLVTEALNVVLLPNSPKIDELENNVAADFSLKDYALTQEERGQKLTAQKLIDRQIKSTAGWQNNDSFLYFVRQPNYLLYRVNLDGTGEEQLSAESLPEKTNYQIILSKTNRLALMSRSGALYLFNQTERNFFKIASQIKGASFSSDDKKLLYFSPNEIWAMWLEDSLIQPYKKAGAKELITRFAQSIGEAIWYNNDNEHIFFIVGNKIKMAELDGRDQRNIIDFLETRNPQIYFADERLIFTDGNALNSVALPKPSLLR